MVLVSGFFSSSPVRPPSAVVWWVPWVGLACFVIMLWQGVMVQGWRGVPALVGLMGAYVAPILLWELARAPARPPSPTLTRAFLPRVITWSATLCVWAGALWLFPWARTELLSPLVAAYSPPVLALGAAILWGAGVIYCAITRVECAEGSVVLGEMLLGRRAYALYPCVAAYARAWMVKAYFLPLMGLFVIHDLTWLESIAQTGLSPLQTFPDFYAYALRLIYFTDVVIALSGYLLTFPRAQTHIRSTEPTVAGWLVCVVCYPPFWPALYAPIFAYEGPYSWMHWLWRENSALQILWGSTILGLAAIYLWATLAFGVRFSNLTHRGILTNGPYRFTKHPAYLAKNLSWWMISVPFLQGESAADALRLSLLLLSVNLIYYARAKTEERHLSQDPTYRAYAAWIHQHGLWARLRAIGT